jgi:predicted transcriptional regulator
MHVRREWINKMEIIFIILGVILALFVLTFIIYFFNLDMKLIRKVYDLLGKHYDTMKRDKKL